MSFSSSRRAALPLTAAASALLLAALAAPASAEGEPSGPPEQPFELTESLLATSVTAFDPAITAFDLSVTALGDTPAESEDVIVLETDILFDSNAWELPASASARIAVLAEEIPQGATVTVAGHTDSKPVDAGRFDFDNQELSEYRAQAVADALASERPDLVLEVTGHGDTEPAVTEDPEDPSTHAANRRVELRYGG